MTVIRRKNPVVLNTPMPMALRRRCQVRSTFDPKDARKFSDSKHVERGARAARSVGEAVPYNEHEEDLMVEGLFVMWNGSMKEDDPDFEKVYDEFRLGVLLYVREGVLDRSYEESK